MLVVRPTMARRHWALCFDLVTRRPSRLYLIGIASLFNIPAYSLRLWKNLTIYFLHCMEIFA